ncbi:hypothetical protein KFL_001310160 [Klebsormidium nitens]|uniref:Calmodulin-lysine N-methyltransferase n=1 Tax=Klebsormidium nitens TaxID=105231 RepID=A0A1Y1I2L6_KLENI|nr:hypothetical protein KFL_001310160 [Klebsormidium nitens]|eukprot:GAQ82986.1 hypothetical protein KFL_001310160 [Klebsormidium nitens]
MAAAKERWRLLAKACTGKRSGTASPENNEIQHSISRVAAGSFGFVKSTAIQRASVTDQSGRPGEALLATDPLHQHVSYEVVKPGGQTVEIILRQRRAGCISLADHRLSQACGVDSTGIVCLWPAEEVLTHYCSQHPELFQGRRVLELGAGYGLAGLAVAACTEAGEVVITDGNPQVVNAIQHNIRINAHLFGETAVRAEPLTWGDDASARAAGGPFDVIIAADCTFFKDFHAQLAGTIKLLLNHASAPGTSRTSTDGAEDPVEPKPVPSTSYASILVADAGLARDLVASSMSEAREDSLLQSDGLKATRASQSEGESAKWRLWEESDGSRTTAGNRSEVTCEIGEAKTPEEQVRSEDINAYHALNPTFEVNEKSLSTFRTDDMKDDGLEPNEPIALLFNPRRGGTLDKFVDIATRVGLRAELSESFDKDLDRKIERLRGGECAEWPGFDEEHCRPIMLILRHCEFE